MTSLIQFFKDLFAKKGKRAPGEKRTIEEEIKLEPKYWQEVIDFKQTLQDIINKHTIEDNNIRMVNDRIITYIEDRINKTGTEKDLEKRYADLDTLADRILVNNLSKIVGLKHTEGMAFSNAVATLKDRLHERKQEEINYQHSKKS